MHLYSASTMSLTRYSSASLLGLVILWTI